MGAPVYDAVSQTFVGMFDVRDILSCVTAAHREYLEMGGESAVVKATHPQDTHQANDSNRDSPRKIQGGLLAKAIQRLKISTKPSTPGAVTVSYLAARNPVATTQTYAKDTSLLEICKGLTNRHMHRVPITDLSSGTPGKFCAHITMICQTGSFSLMYKRFSPSPSCTSYINIILRLT